MRVSISFDELRNLIAEHYKRDVMLSYINEREIHISTSVNAIFITKTVGINVSLLELRDEDVRISYSGGLGTGIIIKGIMMYLHRKVPAYNQMIEKLGANTLVVHIDKVKQLEKVLEYLKLDNILFEKDSVVINTSFR